MQTNPCASAMITHTHTHTSTAIVKHQLVLEYIQAVVVCVYTYEEAGTTIKIHKPGPDASIIPPLIR